MLCGVLNGSERVAEPTVTSKISNGFHKKLPCMQNVAKRFIKTHFYWCAVMISCIWILGWAIPDT